MTTPQQPQDPNQQDPNLPGGPVPLPDPHGQVPGQPGLPLPPPDPYGQVPGQVGNQHGAGQCPQPSAPQGFPAGQFPPPPPPGPKRSTSKLPRIQRGRLFLRSAVILGSVR